MKTLIAIPCMDMVHTDFLRALLSLEVSGEIQFTTAQSSLIYDSRNNLADIAIQGGFGEDLSFCLRARELGAEIWCDSTIKLGHVGTAVYDEDSYRAVSGSNTAQN